MPLLVEGGQKLIGEISLSGAKNAATKAMVASLLTAEPVILKNCPLIGDVDNTAELCTALGSVIKKDGHTLIIQTKNLSSRPGASQSYRNRLPILTLGPLLLRTGRAVIPFVGGDKIGPRPVNWHLTGLKKLGAKIEPSDSNYIASAPNGLQGAEIILPFPSVGATENIILAATGARGRTVIKNAATEPEVIDLIKLLQNMGAMIRLGANRVIYIEGVDKLHGTTFSIMPDRNEAVSFAVLAAATGGDIFIRHTKEDHLISFLNAYRQIGANYSVENNGIRFLGGPLKAINITTDTHPGFMTDWQQPFVVLLTQAEGASHVHETIYENRFGYTSDLNLMGADIKISYNCPDYDPCRFMDQNHPHYATITGPTPLAGRSLTVPDLRAGMAHLIAGLIGRGQSRLDGVEEIDRGYEDIDGRLRSLGAHLTRI